MTSVADMAAASRLAAVASSRRVTELLAKASTRESVRPADGKSEAPFERATIDAEH
jgi:hypothetical protein